MSEIVHAQEKEFSAKFLVPDWKIKPTTAYGCGPIRHLYAVVDFVPPIRN